MNYYEIMLSLMDNKKMLLRELDRGVAIGELRHLTGRIGELYVAVKFSGQMAAYTNQKGYDVISKKGEKISVKTTSREAGSHQFRFTKSTLDQVDRIVMVYITSTNGQIQHNIIFDETVEDAMKFMVSRGKKLVISQSKTKNKENYLNIESTEIMESEEILQLGIGITIKGSDYQIFSEDNNENKIRIVKDGQKVDRGVKPILISILETLGEKVYRNNGDKFTNKQYYKRIKKKVDANERFNTN